MTTLQGAKKGIKPKPDPYLRTQPWKVAAVFAPIERILYRMEADGTVDAAGRQVVFREDGRGGWYDAVAALRGVVEFHQRASNRHGIEADVSALNRLANKLDAGAPIFEAELDAVRICIAACKRQALALRVSQAADIIQTIQISMQMERLGVTA